MGRETRPDSSVTDQSAVLEKLLALPAELRLRVYEQYMAFFDLSGTRRHAPPPLAQVSTVFRNEILPVFCDTYSHRIYIRGNGGGDIFEKKPDRWEVAPKDRAFFASASDERLAAIKNFFLVIRARQRTLEYYRWECRVKDGTFDIWPDHDSKQGYYLDDTDDEYWHTDDEAEAKEEEMTLLRKTRVRLCSLMGEIAARPQPRGLVRGDLDHLLKVWQDVLADQYPGGQWRQRGT